MGIINFYWYRCHYRDSLTIRVLIDTTIDTFLFVGKLKLEKFSGEKKKWQYIFNRAGIAFIANNWLLFKKKKKKL